jgi:hypothetical protein
LLDSCGENKNSIAENISQIILPAQRALDIMLIQTPEIFLKVKISSFFYTVYLDIDKVMSRQTQELLVENCMRFAIELNEYASRFLGIPWDRLKQETSNEEIFDTDPVEFADFDRRGLYVVCHEELHTYDQYLEIYILNLVQTNIKILEETRALTNKENGGLLLKYIDITLLTVNKLMGSSFKEIPKLLRLKQLCVVVCQHIKPDNIEGNIYNKYNIIMTKYLFKPIMPKLSLKLPNLVAGKVDSDRKITERVRPPTPGTPPEQVRVKTGALRRVITKGQIHNEMDKQENKHSNGRGNDKLPLFHFDTYEGNNFPVGDSGGHANEVHACLKA